MMRHFPTLTSAFWLVGSILALGKLHPEQAAALPPPASHPIDFTREIKPIFEASCIKCHGRGKNKGDFRLDTRETFLQGSESGPVVVPGKSAESYLIELVSGVDPDNVMPKKGSKLTPEQVGLLRAWIDQGMPWDQGVSFGRIPPINLFPHKPTSPALSSAPARSQNPIDLLLQSYFPAHGIQPAKPVSDRVFARRVYLDVIGLLPPPEELRDFMADRSRNKRRRLVRRLLSDNPRYAEHWLTFWNDVLRNDYKGTGYIDNGRKQVTGWLYSALATNLPYDRFVAALVNPTADSEGFVNGIVWRGAVNASQTPPMQAAQNISQVFMGVNLKCASCHDSFVNDWALADAYGLASIYAEHELEMVQCDKPTGKKAPMRFLYPELGTVDAKAAKPERLQQLAEIITGKNNGRLSRTIVNRLWAKFMGRGLVEPVDDMETPAWNPDLLDWLAEDLVDHRYDLKETMERILSSQAYQMPAVPIAEQPSKDFVFRGPYVRRMSAEQYVDALATITDSWYALPNARSDFNAGKARDAASLDQPVMPKWIWKDAQAARKTEPGTVYFRKMIDLSKKPTAASVVIACDNSFKLFINGKEAGSGKDHTKPTLLDLRPHLEQGPNVVAVAAVNDPGAPNDKNADQSNPAGLILYAHVRHESVSHGISVETVMDFASDAAWLCSLEKTDGWEKRGFVSASWKHAAELGNVDIAPWHLGKTFVEAASAASLSGHTRACLVNADPLMVALGRPNREQVITTRSSVATTLQALELTNGSTLAERLKRGAARLIDEGWKNVNDLVAGVYERGLSRKPTQDELRLAGDLVGSPARKEGLEDLLWAVTMLPEFQLIY